MTEDRHIVRSYDEELERLRTTLGEMGGLAESNFARALEALDQQDRELAGEVISDDERVDALNHQVQDNAVRVLALRQPVADDLRAVVAALRVSAELERIGDYGANIAKRVLSLEGNPLPSPVRTAVRMGYLAHEILREVIDAYLQGDAQRAQALWERDVEVDDMHTSLFRELLTYMMEDPRNITPCSHLLFVAKNIERIGDHATNVAEIGYYVVTAEEIKGERPKADRSSYALAEPGEQEDGDSGGENG